MAYEVEEARRRLPLRWRHLTPRERRAVANGCGGKGGWINPPDYIFTASCNHHDFQYFLGGEEADRKKADAQFLEAMLHDADREANPAKRMWYIVVAWRYYFAVRFFGKRFFNLGYRASWDDVETEVNNE